MTETNPETFEFSADISQLMNLIINAFYSKSEVFLRELISNASDALDKYRHISLTNNQSVNDLTIEIVPNVDSKTLTIKDNGVGMSKDELVNVLGKIANSGTKAFIEQLKKSDNNDSSLIGQFGVGFYSSYLVADRVDVKTKHCDEGIAFQWSSDGKQGFSIDVVSGDEMSHGTEITLHLKEEASEFLEEERIKDLVKKHSQFVNYPIKLFVTKEEEQEVDDDVEEAAADSEEVEKETESAAADGEEVEKEAVDETNDVTVEDVDETVTETKKKTITVKKQEFELLNEQKPIWCRNPKDVTDDEYKQFYKTISSDHQDYSAKEHFSIEGDVEFKGLIFLPKKAPYDMFNRTEKLYNKIKLYVRKVFITENNQDLMPEYLNFVVGVADSNDLPLNVSREMIQQSRIMKTIRNKLVKKSIEMMDSLSKDNEEAYNEFYSSFSKNIKLGIHEDSKYREDFCKLLRYFSIKNKDKMISLDDYISTTSEGNKNIYYITGENIESLSSSPFVKGLEKKGYDVLLMTDAIDEYMVQSINEYKEYKLVNITKEEIELDETEEEKEKQKELEKENEKLTKHIKEILGDKCSKVCVSNRLVDVPFAVSASKFGWTANMQRIMNAQALGDDTMSSYMMGQKILEINLEHDIVKKLNSKFTADENDKTVKDLVWLLYENALIDAGYGLDNTNSFTQRIYRMVNLGLGGDDADEEDEVEKVEISTDDVQVDSKMEEVD